MPRTSTPPKHCSAARFFRWGLGKLPIFEHAPRPAIYSPVDDPDFAVRAWIVELTEWLATGAGDARKRTLGRLLMRSWNPSIQVPGAVELELVWSGLDEPNRRGLISILQHWRDF